MLNDFETFLILPQHVCKNTGSLPYLPAMVWIRGAAGPHSCSIFPPPTSECEYLTARIVLVISERELSQNGHPTTPPPRKGIYWVQKLHLSTVLCFVGVSFPQALPNQWKKNGHKAQLSNCNRRRASLFQKHQLAAWGCLLV